MAARAVAGATAWVERAAGAGPADGAAIIASDQDAHLLVVIQGQKGEFDDVGRVPETAQKIAEKFGPEMVERLENAGWQFTLDANAPKEAFNR